MKNQPKLVDKLGPYNFLGMLKDETIKPYNVDQTKKFLKSQSSHSLKKNEAVKAIQDNDIDSSLNGIIGNSNNNDNGTSISSNNNNYHNKKRKSDNNTNKNVNPEKSNHHISDIDVSEDGTYRKILSDKQMLSDRYIISDKNISLPYISNKNNNSSSLNIVNMIRNNNKQNIQIDNFDQNNTTTASASANLLLKSKSPINSNANGNNNAQFLSSENSYRSLNKPLSDYILNENQYSVSSNNKYNEDKDKKYEIDIVKEKIKEFQNLNLSERLPAKNLQSHKSSSGNSMNKNKNLDILIKSEPSYIIEYKSHRRFLPKKQANYATQELPLMNNSQNIIDSHKDKHDHDQQLMYSPIINKAELMSVMSNNEDSTFKTLESIEFPKEKERSLFANIINRNRFFSPETTPYKRNDPHAYLQDDNNIKTLQTPTMKILTASITKEIQSQGQGLGQAKPNSSDTKNTNTNRLKAGYLAHSSFDATTTANNNNNNSYNWNTFMHSLHKELPYLFTNKPSGRQEMLNLGIWLHKTLKEIKDNGNLSNYEKFLNADEVYNICLNELIRQVSFECVEKGELIMKIWKSYINLTEDIIEEIKNATKAMETVCKGEYNIQHNTYEIIFKKKDEKYAALMDEFNKFKSEYEVMKNQNHDIVQKELDYKTEIMKLKNMLLHVKKNLQGLKHENANLVYKYQKMKEQFNLNEDDEIDPNQFTLSKQQKQRLSILEQQLSIQVKQPLTLIKDNLNDNDNDDDLRSESSNDDLILKKNIIKEYADKEIQYEIDNEFILNAEIQTDNIVIMQQENQVQTLLELIDIKYDEILLPLQKNNDNQANQIDENDGNGMKEDNEMPRNMKRYWKGSKSAILLGPIKERRGYEVKEGQDNQDQDEIFKSKEGLPNNDNKNEGAMLKNDQDMLISKEDGNEIEDEVNEDNEDNEAKIDTIREKLENSFDKSGEIEDQIGSLKEIDDEEAEKIDEKIQIDHNISRNFEENKEKFEFNASIIAKKVDDGSTNDLDHSALNDLSKNNTKPKSKITSVFLEDAIVSNEKPDRQGKAIVDNMKEIEKEVDKSLIDNKRNDKSNAKTMVIPEPSKIIKKSKLSDVSAKDPEEKIMNKLHKFNTMIPIQQANSSKTGQKGQNSEIERSNIGDEYDPKNVSLNRGSRNAKVKDKIKIIKRLITPKKEIIENGSHKDPNSIIIGDNLNKSNSGLISINEANAIPNNNNNDNNTKTMETEISLEEALNNSMDKIKSEMPSIEPDNKLQKINQSESGNVEDIKSKNTTVTLKRENRLKNETLLNDRSDIQSHDSSNISIKNSEYSDIEPRKSSQFKKKPKYINSNLFENDSEIGLITERNMQIEENKYDNLAIINNELEAQIMSDSNLVQSLKELVSKLQKELNISNDKIHELKEINRLLEARNENLKKVQDLKTKTIDIYETKYTKENSFSFVPENQEDKFIKKGEGKMITRHDYIKNLVINMSKRIIQEKKINSATNLINKIRKKDLNKIKAVIALKPMLKQISQFYNEKIALSKENPIFKDQDMGVFIYKLFLNTYGFKNFAEKKFAKFCLSVRKFAVSIARVSKFARLCCISDPSLNYSTDEQQLYMSILDFLQSSNVGSFFENNDLKKYYVPFVRCTEYLRLYIERRVTLDEYQEIKKDIEKLKEMDNTVSKGYIVDTDVFIDRLIYKYRIMISRYKEYLQPLLILLMDDNTSNMSNSSRIHYVDFYLFYKNIEYDKYDQKKCEELFGNHADIIIDNDDCCLSYDKFIAICFEYELFSVNKQNRFININNNDDIIKKHEDIKKSWINNRNIVNTAINENNDLDELIYRTLSHHSKKLDQMIEGIETGGATGAGGFDHHKMNILKKKASIMRYKLIFSELKLSEIN